MILFHPKVTATALAGALVGMGIAELSRHGIQLAAGEESDLIVLVGFLVGYFVPSGEPAVTPTPTLGDEPHA